MNRNYRMAVDVLRIINEYAEDLQAVSPANLKISDREILEMLIYGTKRLLDGGKITLQDLFFENQAPVGSSNKADSD